MVFCCKVKTEGPNGCGHRLEECLPSGRENVISWDQRIRGQFLFLPLRSHFPLHVLLTHVGTLTLPVSRTHFYPFRWRKMTPFLSAISSVFTYFGPGVQEATLYFHVTKYTEACVDRGEVNGLIHHSGLGLSEPHLGISLSAVKKWDCWRCLLSLKKLQLSPVPVVTDDFVGESRFHR